VAGVKRRAVFDDNMAVVRARIEQAGMKRRAAELDSGRAKRAKPTTSFMDYLPKDEDDRKTTAASSSTAVSPPLKQNGVTKTTANANAAAKAGDQIAPAAKRRKPNPESSATNIDSKADIAATNKDTIPATVSKATHKADDQTIPEAKRRKLNPKSCGTNVDDKANVAATNKDTISAASSKVTSKADDQKISEAKGCQVESKSCAPSIDNKDKVATTDNDTTLAATSKYTAQADDQKTSEAKEFESNSKSLAGNVDNKDKVVATDKATAVAAPSKEGTLAGSSPISDVKAKVVDSVAQSEAVSDPDSSRKRTPQPLAAASDGADTQTPTTENTSVDTLPAKDPPPVSTSESQTAETPEATESITSVACKKRKADEEGSSPSNDSTRVGADEAQTAGQPEATASVPSVADAKRKAEDEGSNPAKKRKLEPRNPYNVLYNYAEGCYINATTHLLHTTSKFSTLREESNKELEANQILTQDEMKSAVLGDASHDETLGNRKKLRDYLAKKAGCNNL